MKPFSNMHIGYKKLQLANYQYVRFDYNTSISMYIFVYKRKLGPKHHQDDSFFTRIIQSFGVDIHVFTILKLTVCSHSSDYVQVC